ncbi:E3 ubiquitin-protein ligase MSL2-like [Clavelina lepadiformis]|uniref:E3 ubiquitin-protein ligase MSL2-like n=1 Tax=Clavelina lepadiformis TaxID=159417 RepID=UPI004041D0B8
MDTENCTNLYLQVCQTFLTCNYKDPSTFEELYKLLPWLRQSLTCCICSNVVTNPMSSTQSHCQHFICRQCRGGRMILRPSCSWCKNQDTFEINQHLVVLVCCFHKICELIKNSPILENIREYDRKRAENLKQQEISSNKEISPKKRRKSTKRREVSSNSLLNIAVYQVLEDGLAVKQSIDLTG